MKMKIKTSTEKYSDKWWKAQITHAESRRKTFISTAQESIRLFNAKTDLNNFTDTDRRLNVWWYCINTLIPAFYSSTPRAEIGLRKRSGGIPHELGSVILERNTQYAMDMHFDFDKVGYQSALQFLLTGQGVLWARYLPKFAKVTQELALFSDPSGKLFDAQGKVYEGDTKNQKKGPGGLVIVSTEVEVKEDERAVLDIVPYTDYLCSDARNESEIEWQARIAYLGEEEARDMFGSDVAEKLNYDSYPEVIKKDIARKDDNFEGKAELYEIWCQASNKVYWLQKNNDKNIIESSEPVTKFDKFYPCSVIRQSVDPDSVIPVSDYAHVKDQILEVERLTTRIAAVTQAIRTNSLYDATLGNQVEALMSGDLKYIPVTNWPSYKARGGISSGVETMNIEAFVNALQVLQAARSSALEQLYETLKVSDLLRGTSEQYKSATANRLENQWSSMGLVVRQNMFSKFVSDGIANLGTIIAEQFDMDRIMDIGDADLLIEPMVQEVQPIALPGNIAEAPEGVEQPEPGEMEAQSQELNIAQPTPFTKEQQIEALKHEIEEILRDNKKRNYRIQIASDSMVAVDQAQQQQEGMQLIQTTGAFFDQMRGLVEQYPPLLNFSIALFQNMIKRFKGGKELDGIFTNAFNQLGDIMRAKEEAAKQPPPPDPTMLEVQGRLQIAQTESQARLQVAQMEMQDKSVKNQISIQDQQLQMQRDQLESQLTVQKQQFEEYMRQQELAIAQQEVQIKANSVQVDMLKVQANAENDSVKHAITQETNRMSQILEIQKLELEQMRIKLSESEKLMEERRLASEQSLERIRLSMENMQRTPSQTIQLSTEKPVIIEKERKRSKKKKGTIISDAEGNPIGIDIEEVD